MSGELMQRQLADSSANRGKSMSALGRDDALGIGLVARGCFFCALHKFKIGCRGEVSTSAVCITLSLRLRSRIFAVRG
jgi:hypothetical protein